MMRGPKIVLLLAGAVTLCGCVARPAPGQVVDAAGRYYRLVPLGRSNEFLLQRLTASELMAWRRDANDIVNPSPDGQVRASSERDRGMSLSEEQSPRRFWEQGDTASQLRPSPELADADTVEQERLQKIQPPLALMRAWITHNAIGNPEARLAVHNASRLAIDAYEIGILCFDRFGAPVNHYASRSNRVRAISQVTIRPGESEDSGWALYGHENTARIEITLEKVHLVDDTIWTPQSGQKVWVAGRSNR